MKKQISKILLIFSLKNNLIISLFFILYTKITGKNSDLNESHIVKNSSYKIGINTSVATIIGAIDGFIQIIKIKIIAIVGIPLVIEVMSLTTFIKVAFNDINTKIKVTIKLIINAIIALKHVKSNDR